MSYDTESHRWHDRALCVGEDPELFFSVGAAGPAIEQTARAKSICQQCSVAISCLATALSIPGATGIWGGTDEVDRRAMVRRYRERVSA